MGVSLHEATVAGFQRQLAGLTTILEKGRAHGLDVEQVVETRLADDMLPFRFQVLSAAHHSWGAVQAARTGSFAPPQMNGESYADLQAVVAEASAGLAGVTPEEVEGFVGKDLVFNIRQRSLPFKAETFLLTFSLPNFHFHTSMTYAILRQAGTPLGKIDYLGRLHAQA